MGLTSDAVALFQYAAENDVLDPDSAVLVLNMSVRRVREAIAELSRLMLLRRAASEEGWRAVDPELAVVDLTGEMEQDIQVRQREVGRLRHDVLDLQAAYGSARRAREAPVEVVSDAVACRIRAHGVQRARKGMCRVQGGHQVGSELLELLGEDVAALERGLALRVVVPEGQRGDPRLRRWSDVVRPLGAEVRTLSGLGRPSVIVDDELALLPRPAGETAVVREPEVVEHLADSFDLMWSLGTQLAADDGDRVDGRPVDCAQSRTILRMLADGHTDETVARRMGLSLRTYRRHTAVLMDRLGARSRFQAGVLAARSRLL